MLEAILPIRFGIKVMRLWDQKPKIQNYDLSVPCSSDIPKYSLW